MLFNEYPQKKDSDTGNDRYSGKNGQGFLFHYSGRLLYGTLHISSPLFNSNRTSEASS